MGCWTDDMRMKTGANGGSNIQLCPADTMQAVLHEVCKTDFSQKFAIWQDFQWYMCGWDQKGSGGVLPDPA